MKEIYIYDTPCGIYCGSCPVLFATMNDTLEELAENMEESAEELRCHGCLDPPGQRQQLRAAGPAMVDQHQRVRGVDPGIAFAPALPAAALDHPGCRKFHVPVRRPGGQVELAQFDEYDKVIIQVVVEEEGLIELPIITQMDFGHTDPMFVLPCGIQAEIDCEAQQFAIVENAVVD